MLFIDIETAPALAYIWELRTRYVPLSQVAEDGHMLCFAASWEGSDEVEYYSLWDVGYQKMVENAWRLLDEADIVIHYNGKNFDVPRLNAEFLKLRMGPPSPYQQIDLYQTVRQNFRVLSRSMNHMLKLLDLEQKVQHKGMGLWTGCMNGDKQDQADMIRYNVGDITTLESLYYQLQPWITNHPNRAIWMPPGETPICGNCGSTDLRFKGYKPAKVLAYKQYRCNNCGAYPRERLPVKESRRGDVMS